MSMERPVLLYDGDCGFCTASATWLDARLGSPAQVRPWQHGDVDSHGVTPVEADAEIHFVTSTGAVLGGADAVLAWWRTGVLPWRSLGAVLRAPGLIQLTRVGYRLIAQNRRRLPGGTAACSAPLQ